MPRIRQCSRRSPSMVTGGLLADDVFVEIITDGVHLSDPMIRLIARTKGPDKVMVITDAMCAAGCPDGLYSLGGLRVNVANGKATLADVPYDPKSVVSNVAGSVALYRDCFRRFVRVAGWPLHEAIKAIKEASGVTFGDIDPNRTWREMTLADMEVVIGVLKYSAYDEFLLIRYDEPALWSCKALEPLEDFWTAFGGLLQECRSAVVNIDTMEYAMLPFAKFRNLNEGPAYTLSVVQERISRASVVEFSEKLDGSMIQMRYLGDNRF